MVSDTTQLVVFIFAYNKGLGGKVNPFNKWIILGSTLNSRTNCDNIFSVINFYTVDCNETTNSAKTQKTLCVP